MSSRLILALDAMGGDQAPHMVLEGIKVARLRYPYVHFLVFGDSAKIAPLLSDDIRPFCSVRHTPDAVASGDKPSLAVRQGRNSSMWLAIKAVKDGEAAGVVSAGNTGALMAMAKLSLRTLPGIDRPAIATLIPTCRGESVMLDLGANAECCARNLVQFAVMGSVFARTLLHAKQPSVGLLNIGSEDQKGTESLREAATVLRGFPGDFMAFKGFVEGDDIGAGTVDVVVTDGFTGNVALKTAEGTAKLYGSFLKEAFRSSMLSRLGYFLARGALAHVRKKTDPRRYNGALFLGLNGICVKSHGGTDRIGFANAIGVAVDLVSDNLNDKIKLGCQDVQSDIAAVNPGAVDKGIDATFVATPDSSSGKTMET